MSELDQIIKVTITRNTTQPSQVGFGTPLLFSSDPLYNPKAGSEWGSERVRAYSSLSGVEADFETTTLVYADARTAFSQNPSPELVKIGKRDNVSALDATFTPTDLTEGATVGFSVNGVPSTVVNGAGATVASIVTALAALTPPTGYTYTDNVTDLGIAATVGDVFRFSDRLGGDLQDLTADGGIAADFAAIRNYDDDFYMVLMDTEGKPEIEAMAAEVEAAEKTYLAQSMDSDVPDTVLTGDTSVAASLNTFDRTMLAYTEKGDPFAVGWAARVLPEGAGTVNWAYQTVNSVDPDDFNATQLNNLIGSFSTQGKRCNVYTRIAGINVTRFGTVGSGEFIDNIRGADRLAARIQERIFGVLANSDKVPYTDSGIQRIRAEVLAQLQEEVSRGFLAAEPAPTCDVPLAATVSAADKSNRVLNNVIFRGTLAGAINKVSIEGELQL